MILSLCTVAKIVVSEGLDSSDIVETGMCNLVLGQDAAWIVTNAEWGV